MIRKAIYEDIKVLAENNISMAKETENILLNKDILLKGTKAVIEDSKKGIYFVDEENKEIRGQLMITTEWSDWRCGYFWWIQSVYVLPKHRKENVFRSLYEYVKIKAEDTKDVCGIRLYVDKNNTLAQKVYKKMGMNESDYLMYEWEK